MCDDVQLTNVGHENTVVRNVFKFQTQENLFEIGCLLATAYSPVVSGLHFASRRLVHSTSHALLSDYSSEV